MFDSVTVLILRIKGFREVLHPMTVVLNQAIEAQDEMDARYAFEVFENLLIVVRSQATVI